MAQFKKTGQAKRLVVAGCLVERYRGDIQRDLPEVDALVGTNQVEQIVAACAKVTPSKPPLPPTSITTSLHASSPLRATSPT